MITAVTRFARFDLTTIVRTQPMRVLLPLLLTVIVCITVPIPGTGILFGSASAALSASNSFQADERGRLDVLYGTSSVTRTAVVLGRYLSSIVFAAVFIALGTATTLVVRATQHQDLGWSLLATMLLAAIAFVGLAYSVQLPWFFAVGFTRGRPMIYIPVGILAVLGFVAGKTRWLDTLATTNVLAPPGWVDALVVGGALLLLALSATASNRLYRDREL